MVTRSSCSPLSTMMGTSGEVPNTTCTVSIPSPSGSDRSRSTQSVPVARRWARASARRPTEVTWQLLPNDSDRSARTIATSTSLSSTRRRRVGSSVGSRRSRRPAIAAGKMSRSGVCPFGLPVSTDPFLLVHDCPGATHRLEWRLGSRALHRPEKVISIVGSGRAARRFELIDVPGPLAPSLRKTDQFGRRAAPVLAMRIRHETAVARKIRREQSAGAGTGSASQGRVEIA